MSDDVSVYRRKFLKGALGAIPLTAFVSTPFDALQARANETAEYTVFYTKITAIRPCRIKLFPPATVFFDKIGHRIKVPVLHLDNADPHIRLKQYEIRLQPVEIRLKINFPLWRQLVIQHVKHAQLASRQRLA